MRSRRPTRPPLPGFALALPSQGSHGEVHVQQKNEKEVIKFFIDVDDTMVSPMVTTNPGSVRGGSAGTFNARPIVPSLSSAHPPPAQGGLVMLPPRPQSVPKRAKDAPAGSYVAALTASHSSVRSVSAPSAEGGAGQDGAAPSDGAAAATNSSANSNTANNSSTETTAKFIHLHNTNLFILMDGISMFYDGKSTYTGNHDPKLSAFLEKKRKEKQEKRERKAREQAANARTDVPAGSPVDTVERAIRDIEDNVANIFSPLHPPRTHEMGGDGTGVPNVPSSLDLADDRSHTASAPPVSLTPPAFGAAHAGTGGFAPRPATRPVPKVPSQFAALFANAPGPVGSPLFGRQRAKAPTPTRSPAPTPASMPAPPTTSATPQGGVVSGSRGAVSPNASPVGTAPSKAASSPQGGGTITTQTNFLSVPSATNKATGSWPSTGDVHQQSVVNCSFSSVASSSQMASIRREASSGSLSTPAEATNTTANGDAGSSVAVTNVRLHQDRYPSLTGGFSTGTSVATPTKVSKQPVLKKVPSVAKTKPVSMEDIGHSNRSLDIDEVEYLDLIGAGSQGKVFRVRLDGKLYALKCMDVREATEATNSEERQGRKRGLVKELTMIRSQRERPPPKYLMQMFNAVATLDGDSQQLNLLIELMSFGVEDCQKMVARIPQVDMMALTQSTFRDHMAGDTRGQQEAEKLLKQQNGSCMHVLGRSRHFVPQSWENRVERQTPMPEIVLSMLAADVLKGLRELHQDYALVHCDLKPANVLLCYDRQSFKLVDFGCCSTMDPETKQVRRQGVDLGSKLYKAPERLCGELGGDIAETCPCPRGSGSGDADDDTEMNNAEVVVFSGKADVWSLGIMLLELGSGVHPCSPFKSDFWNYRNLLKLPKMVKPLSWSPAFCDFVVRCVCVDENKRWSVKQLLGHPFVLKSQSVPRQKLRLFMDRLEKESATYQRRQQREALQKQIELSTAQLAMDNHTRASRAKWGKFNSSLKVVPDWQDLNQFPALE